MKPKDQTLATAYGVQRKAKKMASGGNCPKCMSMGGKCMAHGGEVENEELSPASEVSMPDDMSRDMREEMDDGDDESEDAKHYADGGSIIDDIMEERRMAKGGMLQDSDVEPDFEPRIDMEPVHTREDEMHDAESPSEDDESLVGQVMKERRMKRRGM